MKNSFANLNIFQSVLGFLKKNRIAVKITSFSIVALLSLFVTAAVMGFNIGFKVNYSGKTIAVVKNAKVSNKAYNLALGKICSDEVKDDFTLPKLTLTLTFGKQFYSAEKLAQEMLINNEDLVYASELSIDGQVVAYAQSDKINNLLNQRKTAYYKDGVENSSSFVEKVTLREGYFSLENLTPDSQLFDIVLGLNVKTSYKQVKDITIDYKTKEIRSAAYKQGYYKVTTKGVKGKTQKTVLYETLNGKNAKSEVLSTKVITKVVDEVVTVGTASAYVTATQKSNIKSAGFIFPLPKSSYKISSYWGDGRNHKGVDLCADKGVAIFAVADGKVVYSGYDGDYGYSVVIEHKNGMRTRYAHASALCVRTGTKVSQGDMIAAVGSTGYSTGNHLHFEVILNGTRVNPAPYIGL